MDFEHLPADHLAAGREYLERLRILGLRPEGVFWVRADLSFDPDAEPTITDPWIGKPEWRLFLATSVYDDAGPLKLQKLLFRAYNASLTPKEISPFTVQITSPKTALFRALVSALASPIAQGGVWLRGADEDSASAGPTEMKVGDLVVAREWVYVAESAYPNYSKRVGQLRAFGANIDRLAA
jgi:hypothetical protein